MGALTTQAQPCTQTPPVCILWPLHGLCVCALLNVFCMMELGVPGGTSVTPWTTQSTREILERAPCLLFLWVTDLEAAMG